MSSFANWVALVLSLPTRNATARMRVWRGLKALGCGVLRDGVYLLPDSAAAREALANEAREVTAAGGSASLVHLAPVNDTEDQAWRGLFDRTDDYARHIDDLRRLRSSLKPSTASGLGRRLSALRRALDETTRIDFFPGTAREQAAALLEQTEQALEELLSPGEPRAVAREIPCSCAAAGTVTGVAELPASEWACATAASSVGWMVKTESIRVRRKTFSTVGVSPARSTRRDRPRVEWRCATIPLR